ncbi:DNA-binding transcriptional LysR family regulator [Dokdonella fugitiva]|uniref:DNA-binding transcriptional LysR family regulator n=1 Tax=Dokdonella fugitiva TaxID=328517 RepID=A0A839F2G9_9GAMM|nr:LysR family transcriptional regulator [Dokdonella fugitiva]MBA8889223.1 DNA-binding transcriptional LysR family regulator [Dokdonella fugitiva]
MSRPYDAPMLGGIELFCHAAEAESFTIAATRAGLTPAAVSRAIGRLEARLGVRLFARTTRQVRLTDDGRAYYAQCRAALDRLRDAEREIGERQRVARGVVRISLPTPFGHHRVLPLLPRFRERHPEVDIEVHLDNRNIDFTADGHDLAIRGRPPPDSGLVARKLVDAGLVVVATPAYLQRRSTPTRLGDLERHECLQFVLPSTGQLIPWLFRDDGVDVELATAGGIACSGDLLGMVTLARHGGGLVQTYRFIVEDDLAAGRLVEVLQPYGGRSRPFSLLYPANRHMPLRVRVLVHFLVDAFAPPAPRAGAMAVR